MAIRLVMSSGEILVKNKCSGKIIIIKCVLLAKNVWPDRIDSEGFQSVMQ